MCLWTSLTVLTEILRDIGGVVARDWTDCQALVVSTKVVVQPVCGHSCWTQSIYPLWWSGWSPARVKSDAFKRNQRRSNVVKRGARDVSKKLALTDFSSIQTDAVNRGRRKLHSRQWERYWNLAMLDFCDRPPCSHACERHGRQSNVVHGVRRCATADDRDWPWFTAPVWMLLKPINARFLILSRPCGSKAVEGRLRCSNAVDLWRRSNACEGVSENATLISDCWP